MMAKQVTRAVEDADAVDYRSGTPWDFGLMPDMLRRVAACTKARVRRAEVPFGGSPQPS
ncbi:MAG: hypothetical protein RLZZ437_206 [Pseudomonadota bacterium]|jgi:hypothetical protein